MTAVPPTPTPVAVSPSPLCVGPDGEATPCAPTVTEIVAVGTPPALPATGGDDLAFALIGLGFLLVGISMLPACRRRERDSRVRRGWRP